MNKAVFWDVTSRCNLRCFHCAVGDVYHQNQAALLETTHEESLVILARLWEAGYQHLWMAGGEPLLRRDIVALVAAARRMGFSTIDIVTNGTCLTPQLADALLAAGLHALVVSLDGATAHSHDQIRGRGAYARAQRGLETMLRRRPADSQLQVVAQLTLSRSNLHEMADMVYWANQMKLDGLRMVELKLIGSAQRHAEQLLPSLIEAMDAREAFLEAASGHPHLEIEVFGRPRAIEYFNERFGAGLPLAMPACPLTSDHPSPIYVDASGSACVCSARSSAPVEAADHHSSPQEEDCQLQKHSLAALLGSTRFDGVKQLVSQALEENWQEEFVPCRRCHFRPACQMCPVFLDEQEDKLMGECLLAIQRLARWRKSQKPVAEASLATA